MKIHTIEPTPSPNSMKIVVDEKLPDRKYYHYKEEDIDQAPPLMKALLSIEGVKSLYHVADFIALDRYPKVSWEQILPKVREVFGENVDKSIDLKEKDAVDSSYGEVQVFVQFFRYIPMQIKLVAGDEERRVGLPETFQKAIMKAQDSSPNIVMERQWKEQGIRYGDFDEIGKAVSDELSATYDEERLQQLVKAAYEEDPKEIFIRPSITSAEVREAMKSDDWKMRFAALEKMNPKKEDIPLLAQALDDDKSSIRRLATVYLGMIEDEEVLPYLYKALKDKAVSVRRTAGDCLSDIGSTKAIPAMIEALKDNNKLVRWRAAMFLYEVGDETAIPALKEAESDPEFEVSLQARMARERIESGEEAAGSVWQQMTESRRK
ncbi:virulence factor [Pueribacillus theae]|uniref:Virulence factor n=1 Tax=Pueribacillus theae TaxID=2171751 RepID=A0A2U1K5I6_9BACI|nr:conserved virulence factor C family protein [Pueribacillus theae]PWA12776.1 virulence factor [Pueribacillus theae]